MMDSRGGCCIARYAGGGAYDMSKMNRIMLGFRPIAPKPATCGSASGGSTPESDNNYTNKVRAVRCKRRYNKITNSNNKSRKKRASPEKDKVVTLPLLPETPDCKISQAEITSPVLNVPIWLNFNNSAAEGKNYGTICENNYSDRAVVMPKPVKLLGSCVTVQCVTDTWVDGDGLGCTDEERVMNLEWDACPGFISDELNRVTWTNGAYKEMVGQGQVIVWLVMKERVPVSYQAFTCRVRVQYTCTKQKTSMMTLPCDAWRMDGGGFAWRLDVKAALSLGR